MSTQIFFKEEMLCSSISDIKSESNTTQLYGIFIRFVLNESINKF